MDPVDVIRLREFFLAFHAWRLQKLQEQREELVEETVDKAA